MCEVECLECKSVFEVLESNYKNNSGFLKCKYNNMNGKYNI